MDWRLLGYGAREPWDDRTRTQQDKFNKKVVQALSQEENSLMSERFQKCYLTIYNFQMSQRYRNHIQKRRLSNLIPLVGRNYTRSGTSAAGITCFIPEQV